MNRIRTLDGIRGLAIILVLLWHYLAGQFVVRLGTGWETFRAAFALTWSGVDLFFVLSGFLIVGILLDNKGSEKFFGTFYIRRACRILPLYLLVVLAFFATKPFLETSHTWLYADPLPALSYFTFTQNFFVHGSGFGAAWLGVTWSLAIEEQFYLFIPLLVHWLNRKQLVVVFALIIIASPILRLAIGNLGAYVLPYTRSDAILMGGLLAIAVRTPAIMTWIKDHFEDFSVLMLVMLAGYAALTWRYPTYGHPINHFFLAVIFTVLVAFFVVKEDSSGSAIFKHPIMVWFGLRSYGLYLLHMPVLGMVYGFMGSGTIPLFSNVRELIPTIVSLVILFVLADLSYRFFEAKFLAYGRKFTFKHD